MKKALLLSILTILTACHGASNKTPEQSDSAATDSAEVIEPVIARLPDTTYASASKISYKIEICDPDTPGIISSLVDLYAYTPGTFTFRQGLKRQADFHGSIDHEPTDLSVDWTFHTQEDYSATSVGRWGGGSGWTGQPLYVEWPDTCLTRMKSAGAISTDASGKEIMVGSLYGSVYFIDYETGKASRPAIAVGNPIKGTISLDPTLNGNLYVGQGVPGKRPFGALAIDLYSNKQFHFFAEDPKAQRRWGAYDSSPLRLGQFLFRPGENGGFYKLTVSPGELKMHSVLRYTIAGNAPGIESSMAIYANYGFTADNHGNLICINLDTLKPVWLYQLGDDTDATPLLAVENGTPYLYVGCEIDLQDAGSAKFVKINALNGEEVWKAMINGRRVNMDKKHFDGGFYSSAVLGTADCEGLIYANCVKNTSGQNGVLVAINRQNGEIAYETPLKYYAWSSPVTMTSASGKMYVITADCTGNMYIISGKDGNIITTKNIGSNFESSPVVRDNHLVVGSRGNSIFKISVR